VADVADFSGAVPALYHAHLGPVLFEPYAEELVGRLPHREALRVLELACGTGIVSRRLREALPPSATLVVSDLNEAMVAFARDAATIGGIEWVQADAQALPFPDRSFDVVVCQFGLMFLPDKVQGFREAHRVLAEGGTLIASVWRSTEENPGARVAQAALNRLFPDDPPRFIEAVPHGYHDLVQIEADMRAAGWREMRFESVAFEREAESAETFAGGFVLGTPLRFWLEERGADLAHVTQEMAAALAELGGARPFRVTLAATVITAVR